MLRRLIALYKSTFTLHLHYISDAQVDWGRLDNKLIDIKEDNNIVCSHVFLCLSYISFRELQHYVTLCQCHNAFSRLDVRAAAVSERSDLHLNSHQRVMMTFPAGPDHAGRVRVRLGGSRFAFHIHAVQIAVAARVEPPRAV